MTLRYICYLIVCTVFSIISNGCSRENGVSDGIDDNVVRMRLAVSRNGGYADNVNGNDSDIGSLTGFRIVDTEVKEVFSSLEVAENGWCVVKPSQKTGSIYFVANVSERINYGNIKTLNDLMSIVLSGEEMTDAGVPMTGVISLDKASDHEVKMKRSVARVDIDALSHGVEVKEVHVSNIAESGKLWNDNQSEIQSSNVGKVKNRDVVFQQPLAKEKRTVCYLYEQVNDKLDVIIKADVEGVEYAFETKLPKVIRRNTVYTLKVNGVGGKLDVSVQEETWDGTDEITAGEEKLEFTVDIQSSSLPDGVEVSEKLDRVTVPYTETEFDFMLNTVAGTELKISGQVEGVEVTIDAASRSGLKKVHVKSGLKSFTDLGGNVQIEAINSEGVSVGEVVLSFNANPCRLTGGMVFDKDNYCRFSKQVEGEIGVLFVPENMRAELRFDFDENQNRKPWINMVQREDGSYRLLSGWCETYKKSMNGTTEAAHLVITDEKGKESVYTITRPYRSIPTVKVDNNYWSMFAMVGNSKNLEEQIDMEITPDELMEYMKTCPEEEFLRLISSQYQGGNPQAVVFQYDEANSKFNYRGFTEAALAMNTVKDEDMLPEGWRMPTQQEVGTLSFGSGAYSRYWNGINVNIGGKNYNIEERFVRVNGHEYGNVYIWSIKKNSPRLIFCSFRPQHNINGLVGNRVILPAARGANNTSWALEIDGSTFGVTTYIGWLGGIATHTLHSIKVLPEYVYK